MYQISLKKLKFHGSNSFEKDYLKEISVLFNSNKVYGSFTKSKFFGKLQNLSDFDLNLSFFAEGLYSLFQQICSE